MVPVVISERVILGRVAAAIQRPVQVVSHHMAILGTDIEETANVSKMKELSDIIVATDILKEIIYLPHPDAEPILKAYDCLNEIGKQKAIERVEELTEIPRYRAAPVQEPQDTECKGGEEE